MGQFNDLKITEQEFASHGMTSLPGTKWTNQAEMLKMKLDEDGTFVGERLNEVLDALEGAAAAGGIGAKKPDGVTPSTVQSELGDLNTEKHNHANKLLLDTYTQTEADLADAVEKKHGHVNKAALDGITEVTQALGSASNKVPSEKAVSDAMAVAGNLPAGGTVGQVLRKKTNTSYDAEWGDAVPIERTINSKPLSADITLTAGDVGAAKYSSGTLTLEKTGWSAPDAQGYFTKEATVSGITAADNIDLTRVISVSNSEAAEAIQTAWNLIAEVVAGTNKLTFYAVAVPEAAIPLAWKLVR